MQTESWSPLPSTLCCNHVCNASRHHLCFSPETLCDTVLPLSVSNVLFQHLLPPSLILQYSPHNKLKCLQMLAGTRLYQCLFPQWSLVWGSTAGWLTASTHSSLPLLTPTQPQPYPSVGGSAAQDQSLRLGTHMQPVWAHGSGALAFILLTHTETKTHTHTTHTLPTHMQYPHWFLEHLFNDVMCLTSKGNRGRGNTWECVGCTCCMCVFVSESCCQI